VERDREREELRLVASPASADRVEWRPRRVCSSRVPHQWNASSSSTLSLSYLHHCMG
jgi:hypothetical protein